MQVRAIQCFMLALIFNVIWTSVHMMKKGIQYKNYIMTSLWTFITWTNAFTELLSNHVCVELSLHMNLALGLMFISVWYAELREPFTFKMLILDLVRGF